jgi:hypothetical protein
VSTEKFLKQRAVNIAVNGHYTLPNWYDPQGKLRTFACRTTRVSPYRMMVDVPVVGKVGDCLTSISVISASSMATSATPGQAVFCSNST